MGFVRKSVDEPGGPNLEACRSCRQYLRTCEPAILKKDL